MNTNALAKHYDQLGPWERLQLITAASARGDDIEAERLARSAPMVAFRVPNYFGLSDGLQNVAMVDLMTRLDLAALFWRIGGVLAEGSALGLDKNSDRLDRAWKLVAFRMVQEAEVWRLLCHELKIDPELLLRDLPGYEMVRHAEGIAAELALPEAEALAVLREGRKPGSPELRFSSPAEEVAALRKYLTDQQRKWS